LRQLLAQCVTIPEQLVALYNESQGMVITSEQYDNNIRLLASSFLRIYVVADALDECATDDSNQRATLRSLRDLPETFRLFATSRPIDGVKKVFAPALDFKLTANTGDIEKYVVARLATAENLKEFLEEDQALQARIMSRILDAAQGMYVALPC
jgi:hypothetical protein